MKHVLVILWVTTFNQTGSISAVDDFDHCWAPAGFFGYCVGVTDGQLRIMDAHGSVNEADAKAKK